MSVLLSPARAYGLIINSESGHVAYYGKPDLENGIFSPFAGRHDIWTDCPEKYWNDLARQHRVALIAHCFPNAVIGYSTGFNGFRSDAKVIYLSSGKDEIVDFPGLKLMSTKGAEALQGDMPLGKGGLFLAGPARFLLENLTESDDSLKTVGISAVEDYLANILLNRGGKALDYLLENATDLADPLGMQQSLARLGSIKDALYGREGYALTGPLAISIINAVPYDQARMDKFEKLLDTCLEYEKNQQGIFVDPINYEYSKKIFAFFESYFSNFIEGTRFSIEEAHDIISSMAPSPTRPKDSHDILGVYHLAINPEACILSQHKKEIFISSLKQMHKMMMVNRPEADPGEFKSLRNMAGNTLFVEPHLVKGTLNEVPELLQQLPEGFAKAIFFMAALTEIHPFTDGNGRIARLAMNANLSSAGQSRIIVPSLARDEYIDCLKCFSQQDDAKPLLDYMRFLQQWTSDFPFEDFGETQELMEKCNAFEISRVNYRLLRLAQPNPPANHRPT